MKRSRSVEAVDGGKRVRLSNDGDGGQREQRRGSEPPSYPVQQAVELEGFDPNEYFQLERKKVMRWRGGPVKRTFYGLKLLKNVPSSGGLERQVMYSKILESAFRQILSKAPKSSKCQLIIENAKFNKGVISTCIQKPKKITFSHIADRLNRVMTSDEHVDITRSKISLTSFSTAYVGVSRKRVNMARRYVYDQSEFLTNHKRCTYNPSVSKITQRVPDLCAALVIARELHAMDPNRQGRISNYLYTSAAVVKAKELVKQAGLQPPLGPFTLEQLPEFAKCLPADVSLRFFTGACRPIINVDRGDTNVINVALAYNVDAQGRETFHCHGIISLKAYFAVDKLCLKCFKADHSKKNSVHRCVMSGCKLCKHSKCLNTKERIPANLQLCEGCLQYFASVECVAAHSSSCDQFSRCLKCKLPVHRRSSHSCVRPSCKACEGAHSPLELCYVKADPAFNVTKRKPVWYADSESTVDAVTGEHSTVLVILQKSNGRDYHDYRGRNSMRDFVKDCLDVKSPYKNSYIVWHNASGYDAHLWWRELIRINAPPKNIIRRGQKILSMELSQNSIVCRDSLLFISGTPLSAFPKMFGLDSGPKGDFPHGLNTKKWINFDSREVIIYKEVIDGKEHRFPPIAYFWPHKKHADEVKKLRVWHSEQVARYDASPELKYCPEDQLVAYCRQDVSILREGFEKFREACLAQFPSMDPLHSMTLPSYNNAVIRNFCLPEKSLGLIPPMGFDGGGIKTWPRSYSPKSIAWLSYLEHKEGLTGMMHARKLGERRITRHYVDGVAYSGDTLQIMEFHGCRFHAHSADECAMRTEKSEPEMARARQLRTALTDKDLLEIETSKLYGSVKYRRIFECEFDQQCEDDPEMKAFVEDYMSKYEAAGDPLCPREALRGGRINAIKFRVDPVPEGHSLHYLDFTSLYPAVNASVNGERWPIGYPEIYIGKDMERAPKHWYGLAKVEILPPRGLKHPVLGQPVGDKVIFHLCTECSETRSEGPCTHSDEDRMIHGTFFTGEIDLAIEMGYKVSVVHELWHWEKTSKELFRPFIAAQYKNKVMASRKPSDPTEVLQDLASLGIQVEDSDWEENAAVRLQSKGSCNNIWGFMSSRTDHENTEVVTTLARLRELESDDKNPITRIELAEDEQTLFVVTKPTREKAGKKHNLVIGILTTAFARMRLYNIIRQYPEEIVYFDTDSVVLCLPDDKPPPKTSNRLGELKNEVEEKYGAGAKMVGFTSIGPKSYTYRVEKDGVVVGEELRLKGLKLTEETKELMTAENLAALAPDLDAPDPDAADPDIQNPSIPVPQHIIKKDLFKTSLRNVELIKHIRFNCTKRWLIPKDNPHLDTLPFGY